MLVTLLKATALSALLQGSDTTVSVNPEARLDVHVFGGEVVVRTWDRNQVRVVADHSSRDRVEVKTSNTVVRVRSRSRTHGVHAVDFRITIPASMAVEISGTYVAADIEGVRSEVKVETVQGDLRLRGGRGYIALHSVQGDVELYDANGRINVHSVNGKVRVIGAGGVVEASTVNGQITLRRIPSDAVDVTTVNGSLVYDGTIQDGGRYAFSTHNGNITLGVPPGTNASVSVSTFNGDFETDFPVTLTESRGGGKRFGFTLGTGSARIELSSFGGTIRLRRPSSR